MNSHFNAILISITATMFLVLSISITENNSSYDHKSIPQDSFSTYHGGKLPELEYYEHYYELQPDSRSVVIFPIFTQSAYDRNGFHTFYTGRCDDCTTVEIENSYEKLYSTGANGFRILEFLGYEVLDDIDIDKNPEILHNYDKVVLLHNEFVTEAEFQAITNHPNVVYLYPNALSSKVVSDYSTNQITLIRGPGYPENGIENGFDWKYDNSQYFEDWDCLEWEFYEIENGYMLNCYPELILPLYGLEILKSIKEI